MRKQEQKGKITALYERLSHDDGRSDESVSVENQKRILEDYARKNGFTNVRHFTDDGVRGTTFKRPGLDAMVDEIRAGNVATVIVKDDCDIIRLNAKPLWHNGLAFLLKICVAFLKSLLFIISRDFLIFL